MKVLNKIFFVSGLTIDMGKCLKRPRANKPNLIFANNELLRDHNYCKKGK